MWEGEGSRISGSCVENFDQTTSQNYDNIVWSKYEHNYKKNKFKKYTLDNAKKWPSCTLK